MAISSSNTIDYVFLVQSSYEEELQRIRWSGLRKGMVLGTYIGRVSLPRYIVYAGGFMFGSVLIFYEDHAKLTISDILVVSNRSD